MGEPRGSTPTPVGPSKTGNGATIAIWAAGGILAIVAVIVLANVITFGHNAVKLAHEIPKVVYKGPAASKGDSAFEWGGFPLSNTVKPLAEPKGITYVHIATGVGRFGTPIVVALDQHGDAWAWGWNGTGALGDGTLTGRASPTRVLMPKGVTFAVVAVGDTQVVALDSSGRAWQWGTDFAMPFPRTVGGLLRPTLVPMPAGVVFTQVSGGFEFAVALDSTGRIWTWGSNYAGQLGDGTAQHRTTAALRTTPALIHSKPGLRFVSVHAGGDAAAAFDSAGNLWSWGADEFGQLGSGASLGNAACPRQADAPQPCATEPVEAKFPAGVRIVAAALGRSSALALDDRGRVWAWGDNRSGQLGLSLPAGRTSSDTPKLVASPVGITFSRIAAGAATSLAIDVDGRLWGWGYRGLVPPATTCPDRSFGCVMKPAPLPVPRGVKIGELAANEESTIALAVR